MPLQIYIDEAHVDGRLVPTLSVSDGRITHNTVIPPYDEGVSPTAVPSASNLPDVLTTVGRISVLAPSFQEAELRPVASWRTWPEQFDTSEILDARIVIVQVPEGWHHVLEVAVGTSSSPAIVRECLDAYDAGVVLLNAANVKPRSVSLLLDDQPTVELAGRDGRNDGGMTIISKGGMGNEAPTDHR